jgi:hypothetical protein
MNQFSWGTFKMNILENLILTSVTALATAAFTFWGYWRHAKADLEKEYLSRFNTKKWEVYTEFAKLAPELMGNEIPSGSISTEIVSIDSLASQIVLAGSDKVVTAFRIWRETAHVYGQGNELTKAKLFDLIAEMRRDLGNMYTRLNMDDLLGALKTVF